MPPKKNLTGLRFGKLTVVNESNERKNGAVCWVCKCDCGGWITTSSKNLEWANTRSCGCLHTFDLTGQQFGYLVVIGKSKKKQSNRIHWFAQCSLCGNLTCVAANNLDRHHTISCGCLQPLKASTHGKSDTRIYEVWKNMLARCYNPKDNHYHNYGGRGIKVCDRWHTFETFYEDMGDPPEGKSIERVENNGNYEPSNCIWATWQEQMHNKRAKGYTWSPHNQKWTAAITVNYKRINLGSFDTPEEAQRVYREAKIKYHGVDPFK